MHENDIHADYYKYGRTSHFLNRKYILFQLSITKNSKQIPVVVLARDIPDGGKKSALPLSTRKAVPQLPAVVE
jgi:hypothetical protein